MTPDQLKHQARVYLAQARATKHRDWSFTLIAWAGKCRREAMKTQRELFA